MTLLIFGVIGFRLTKFSNDEIDLKSLREVPANLVYLNKLFSIFIVGLILLSILIEVVKSIISLVNFFRKRKLRSIRARIREGNELFSTREDTPTILQPVEDGLELDTVRKPKKFNPI